MPSRLKEGGQLRGAGRQLPGGGALFSGRQEFTPVSRARCFPPGPPWRWEPSAGVLRAQEAPESRLPSGVCVCVRVRAREHIGGGTRPHTDVSPRIHFQSLSVITRRAPRGRCAVKKGFNYL